MKGTNYRSKNISILGCGWLGFPLAKHLKNNGHIVKGSSRSKEKLAMLEKAGIYPFQVDIEQLDDLETSESFLQAEVLIVTIPLKNKESHEHLAGLIKNSNIKQIIYTSSTGVYEPAINPVSENGVLKKDHPLVDIEKGYQSTGIPTCILRLSGLVGPDRHPGRFFRKRPDALLSRVPINLIHLNDVILVFDWTIENQPCREIFNITSKEHPMKFDFYSRAYMDYYKKPAQFQLSTDEKAFKYIQTEKWESFSRLRFSLKKYYPRLF